MLTNGECNISIMTSYSSNDWCIATHSVLHSDGKWQSSSPYISFTVILKDFPNDSYKDSSDTAAVTPKKLRKSVLLLTTSAWNINYFIVEKL